MDDYKTVKLSYLVDEMKLKILYRSTDYETKRLTRSAAHRLLQLLFCGPHPDNRRHRVCLHAFFPV